MLAALYRERDIQRARAKQRDPASATNSRGPERYIGANLTNRLPMLSPGTPSPRCSQAARRIHQEMAKKVRSDVAGLAQITIQ